MSIFPPRSSPTSPLTSHRMQRTTAPRRRPRPIPHPSTRPSRWSWLNLPHAAAWEISYQSVNLLLAETDPIRRASLTQKWLRNMEQHLTTTLVTVSSTLFALQRYHLGICNDTYWISWAQSAVISAAVCSSLTWANFDGDLNGSICLWIVKTAWNSALVFSMGSIAAACQQIGCLHRLTSHPEGLKMMRRLLAGRKNTHQSTNRLQLSQRIMWQIPAMLLNGSLYLYVAGQCIVFYWDANRHWDKAPHGLIVSTRAAT